MKGRIENQEMNPIDARVCQHSFGFTLVELIALITVIGIVVGITFAGCTEYYPRMPRSRTAATIYQISTAIEMFKADMGGYPPDFTCTSSGKSMPEDSLKASEYVWPCEALWFWLEYNNPHQKPQYQKEPYLVFKRHQVAAGNTKINALWDQSPGYYMRIVDDWGNPLNYKSIGGNSYRFTDGSNAPRHCPQSYDLCVAVRAKLDSLRASKVGLLRWGTCSGIGL